MFRGGYGNDPGNHSGDSNILNHFHSGESSDFSFFRIPRALIEEGSADHSSGENQRLPQRNCLGRLYKTLLKKAGITENIPFHGLRHTFATLAIQQGVDAKTVSSILGHYSAGFTLDTYTHVTGEMQKEAAQRMGSFMAQQAE